MRGCEVLLLVLLAVGISSANTVGCLAYVLAPLRPAAGAVNGGSSSSSSRGRSSSGRRGLARQGRREQSSPRRWQCASCHPHHHHASRQSSSFPPRISEGNGSLFAGVGRLREEGSNSAASRMQPFRRILGAGLRRRRTDLPSSAFSGDAGVSKDPIDRAVHFVKSDGMKKLGVWLGFFAVMYQVRPFYGVMLGTFVLTYMGNTSVRFLMRKCNFFLENSPGIPFGRLPRKVYASLYTTMLFMSIFLASVLAVPRISIETEFLMGMSVGDNPYMLLNNWVGENFGVEFLNRLEPFLLSLTGEAGRIFAGYESNYRELIAKKLNAATAPWSPERNLKLAKLLQYSLSGYVKQSLALISSSLQQLTGLIYKTILSLLFSTMLVFDMPALRKQVNHLRYSKNLSFPFAVLAPQIKKFGILLGQSFEVQFAIAMVNTLLTILGLLAIGVKGVSVMGLLVFLCSFIPVVGVFLSTVPMVLSCLSEGCMHKVVQVIGMVVGVHVVEAYLLNPQIYSSKLKLSPIYVLLVLYIAEHAVGVQGLLIAVPLAVYMAKTLVGNEELSKDQVTPQLE